MQPNSSAIAFRWPTFSMLWAFRRMKQAWMEHGLSGLWGLVTLYLKVCLNPVRHKVWLDVLATEPGREACAHYSRMAYRYTLPCLSVAFQGDRTLRLLRFHYGLIQQRFRPGFSVWVYGGQAELWSSRVDGHDLSVVLLGLCSKTRHREGELSLSLLLDGEQVCHLSFSFIDAGLMGLHSVGSVPYLGRVQGQRGGLDRFRQATRLCHDTSPVDVLLRCLGGIATALSMPCLAGVDQAHNISHAPLSRRNEGFDYTDFWQRHGARALEHGHHILPWPLLEKPIEQVASKHRQRTLRKRQFKRAVSHEVAERLKPWVL